MNDGHLIYKDISLLLSKKNVLLASTSFTGRLQGIKSIVSPNSAHTLFVYQILSVISACGFFLSFDCLWIIISPQKKNL